MGFYEFLMVEMLDGTRTIAVGICLVQSIGRLLEGGASK